MIGDAPGRDTQTTPSGGRAVELLLTLDRAGEAEGLTRQLYAQLRRAILEGRLRAGERLPPTRDLARQLRVARLTVATAYDWLRAEGYVYGRVGAGTFVAPAFEAAPADDEAHALPIAALRTVAPNASAGERSSERSGEREAPTDDATHPPLSAWARRIATIPLIGAGGSEAAPFDFRPNAGAAEEFPWARWRRAAGWPGALDWQGERRAGVHDAGAGANRWDALLGPVETRAAIAGWLRRSRAVRCEPEQVLIASSVQQILALVARLLVEPGQGLIVEDPSYIGFHAAFLAEGAVLRGAPVDAAGIRVEALPDPARRSVASRAPDSEPARLIVVTPSHQYPTGVTLSLERRVALLEWARRAQALVVEDDYDGDLRLEGLPLEALRGLDERDETLYLGTFAKALYPATRLAFAVLPRWLVEPMARARAASDRHPAWRDAQTVARFIEAGELERHLARVRRLYRARRDALVAALRAELDGLVAIGPAEAGMHLLAGLPAGTDDVALAAEAQARGVSVAPLSPHFSVTPRPGLLLGFGGMPEERLAEGVRLLAPLVRAQVERGSGIARVLS